MSSIKEIENEVENAVETAIVKISETKSDVPTQPHNGKKIDRIIISQYIENDPYAVTYSKEDNSIHGWNIEENGQQRPHVYFKFNYSPMLDKSVLYKKIFTFISGDCKYLF